MSKNIRYESDSLGKVKLPKDVYYGSQTHRSLQHFSISDEKIPIEYIVSLAYVKLACANTNYRLEKLSQEKHALIVRACREIIKGKLFEHFPLSVWQSGSGTQTNMNMNEVIANYCCMLKKKPLGSKDFMHPNSDINKYQSTNDVIPTALHLCVLSLLSEKLYPALEILLDTLKDKVKEFKSAKKSHGISYRFKDLFNSYLYLLEKNLERCLLSEIDLLDIPIGGTAIGTGLNAPKGYDEEVVSELSNLTKFAFRVHPNKFSAISTLSEVCQMSKSLKVLAQTLFKIACDIRYLSSGPRCGLGEIIIPENEPGSTIMPGKINPTQCEALTMLAIQVMSNDEAISFGVSHGYFEASSYRTVIIYNITQSIKLLSDGITMFTKYCARGMTFAKKKLD